MKTKSARAYVVHHVEGHVTATLLRSEERFFDAPPPSAIGPDVEAACAYLDASLRLMFDDGESIERYLWEDDVLTETVEIDVHALSAAGASPVIGARTVPLRVSAAVAKMPRGGVRVMVPRFGWSFVCEHVGLAPVLLRTLLQGSLVGESPRSLVAYRHGVREHVTTRTITFDETRAPADVDVTARAPTLEKVAEDWTERALRKRLPPVLFGTARIEAEAGWLDRRPLPSFVLVGPPGAGKTAEVRRLAHTLAARKKRKVAAPRLWATSGERLTAGMIYLGEWQDRVLRVATELASEGDFMHVDRLGSILKKQHDGSTIADLLLGGLVAEQFALIAECTPREWERAQRESPELAARLVVIHVPETPAEAMPALLAEAQRARTPIVTIVPEALRRLCTHLSLLDRTQAFPGKGMRFLEWLVPSPEHATPRVLGPLDASEAYARYTGVPVSLVADEHTRSENELAIALGESVIGQTRACEVVARVLARFKAGLADPERPLGTLLFTGPTGVGKTETAKAMARTMLGDEKHLVRVDCGELAYPGSAARLLASGEGSRSLAVRVRETPLTVVLLDEIEKAHPEVLDLLLGVMGEGRLTDASGRDVDFRGAVIVMTSNLGTDEATPVGFGSESAVVALRKVRAHFRPEMWARIDDVVPFGDLSRADLLRIVALGIDEVRRREGLIARGITLRVTDALAQRIADRGYEPGRGARPLKRAIEELVVTPLAVRLSEDPSLAAREIVLDL